MNNRKIHLRVTNSEYLPNCFKEITITTQKNMEYSEEPRLIFSPLTPKNYCKFYCLEMDSFDGDVQFYKDQIAATDTLLELGCGSGRLTRKLATNCQSITAIDISSEMINLAQTKPSANVIYKQMDMTDFYFDHLFDIIIIPYNTLNLLGDKDKILTCLQLCRKHSKFKGKLLLHLYHPDHTILSSAGKKIFQFAFLEQDNTTKIIKETFKSYSVTTATLTLEERYRVRPMDNNIAKEDLKHILHLFSPVLPVWKKLLGFSGFSMSNCWGNYKLKRFSQSSDTILLVQATPV